MTLIFLYFFFSSLLNYLSGVLQRNKKRLKRYYIIIVIYFRASQFEKGQAQLILGLDEVYTLTTSSKGKKGTYSKPPDPAPFPLFIKDDFSGDNHQNLDSIKRTTKYVVLFIVYTLLIF